MDAVIRKADNGYLVEGQPSRYMPRPPRRVAIEMPQLLAAIEEIMAIPEPEEDDF